MVDTGHPIRPLITRLASISEGIIFPIHPYSMVSIHAGIGGNKTGLASHPVLTS